MKKKISIILILTILFCSLSNLSVNANMRLESLDLDKKIIFGIDPGLGIYELHDMGLTGKGVNIAYIDQTPRLTHEELTNIKIKKYIEVNNNLSTPQYHGTAVLSLLSGKNIGIVPEANIYYIAHPAWLLDQKTHATAIEEIIKINKTLSDNDKIKIIGLSDGIDTREKNTDLFIQAIQKAEQEGIIVIHTETLNMIPGVADLYVDKNNYKNYNIEDWYLNRTNTLPKHHVIIPTIRTIAREYSDTAYEYEKIGGLSWAVPYLVGVITMGFQIDSTLTKEQIIDYLYVSAFQNGNKKIINPKGFINLVKSNKQKKDVYYLLYNKNYVTNEDMEAIKQYINNFDKDLFQVVLQDVSKYKSAYDIYQFLKQQKNNINGIQILGINRDVPAFNLQFEINFNDGIDDMGYYKSDFFYSNLDNNVNDIKNYSVYKHYKENRNVSLIPKWPVIRLPITKGDYVNFFNKYYEYVEQTKLNNNLRLVNFSNSIFASNNPVDDMNYFIKERIDKEFNIIKENNYSLYNNLQGYYKTQIKTNGDTTQDNLVKENKLGINNFIINCHGQKDNLEKSVFKTSEKESEYRVPLLNNSNINKLLDNNFYNMYLWACNNAEDMDNKNLVYQMLANGKAIHVTASTSVLSNNGTDNKANLNDIKNNNFYSFYYAFLKNMYEGKNKQYSFMLAQKEYINNILLTPNNLKNQMNFQFNVNNLLLYNQFGIMEHDIITNMKYETVVSNSPIINKINNYVVQQENKDIIVNNITTSIINSDIEFELDIDSYYNGHLNVFSVPDRNLINIEMKNIIKVGKNKVKFLIPFNKLYNSSRIVVSISCNKKTTYSSNFIYINCTDIEY